MESSRAFDSQATIVAQAPCRADLAGGTIDLWPLYLFHPGALTLNFAVNILTTCRITPLKGKRIQVRSLDTGKEEQFASFDDVRRAKRFKLPLAARLLQFFAPKEGLLIETDSESPAGAGISGSSALMNNSFEKVVEIIGGSEQDRQLVVDYAARPQVPVCRAELSVSNAFRSAVKRRRASSRSGVASTIRSLF